MKLYRHNITGEVREFDPAYLATLPKAALWSEYSEPEQPQQTAIEPVRAAQIRQWLIDHDLLEIVESALDNAQAWPDEKTRLKAKARWEYEVNIHRDDPLVVLIAQRLGLTPLQLDQAFIEASEIP